MFWTRWEFWLYLAAWLPYTLFALFYAFRSPWYRSAVGRSLLLSKVAIVSVLTNVLVVYAFGDYDARGVVRSLLIGAVICAGWYQLATLLRVQRQARLDLLAPEPPKE